MRWILSECGAQATALGTSNDSSSVCIHHLFGTCRRAGQSKPLCQREHVQTLRGKLDDAVVAKMRELAVANRVHNQQQAADVGLAAGYWEALLAKC
jgi:hypothetical protein